MKFFRNVQDVSRATMSGLKNTDEVNVISIELDSLSSNLKSLMSNFQ